MGNEDQFCVVWNPEYGLPRCQHASIQIARDEALRLASQNPGASFIVMSSLGEFKKVDVEWKDHTDDIPF